jgi:hypothetical protein
VLRTCHRPIARRNTCGCKRRWYWCWRLKSGVGRSRLSGRSHRTCAGRRDASMGGTARVGGSEEHEQRR